MHELGHSLNLLHTHQSGGADGCTDTIADNQSWSKDEVSQNSFSCDYANCTASQRGQVDIVFNNIMSYHVDEPQLVLSPCQKDRVSSQGDTDRAWLLSKEPVYVNSGYIGFPFSELGRFSFPYNTVQEAVDAGLSGKVLVLQEGTYTHSTDINTDVEIMTRSGSSDINGVLKYSLPLNLESSANPKVRVAVRAAKQEHRNARKTMRDEKINSAKITDKVQKAALKATAKSKRKKHMDNARTQLKAAEKAASGKEKIAIQLSLAQRYRDAGDCANAVSFFNAVAQNTVQKHLRTRVLYEISSCQKKIQNKSIEPEDSLSESDN